MVGAGSPDGRQRRHAGAAWADGEPGRQQRCAGAATASTAAPPTAAHGAGLAHEVRNYIFYIIQFTASFVASQGSSTVLQEYIPLHSKFLLIGTQIKISYKTIFNIMFHDKLIFLLTLLNTSLSAVELKY